MKTKEQAIELSNMMRDIGKLANRETVCILTNMEEPLGKAVGNSLEIIESVECLKGNMPEDVKETVLALGSYIIKLAGKGNDIEKNKKKILENIENGKAYTKFLELVQEQGGDIEYIKNTNKFERAKYILPVIAEESGYIEKVNGEKIGHISVNLGAGRIKKEDSIDYNVGIVLNKKVSEKVEKGETLAYIHANDEEKGDQAVKDLIKAYKTVDYKINKPEYILEIIE